MGNSVNVLLNTMGQGISKHFTNKQEKVFREAFSHFDANNDGEIDKEEIIRVMSNLGVEVSVKDLENRMIEYDKDRNGSISFSEFVSLMKEVVSDVNDDARIKEAFSLFDKDNNGHIDVEELDTIMKQLGQELNFSQIIEMVAVADLDKNGKISLEEFTKLVKEPF